MLEYLLRRAYRKPDEAYPLEDHDILNRCLKAVLPICNGNGAIRSKTMSASGIKIALATYVKSENEASLYAPFMKASNIALACLHELHVPGMRGPASDDVDMFIQINDPKRLDQFHRGETSTRKPDLVVLPFVNKSEYFADAALGHWDEYVLSPSTSPKDWKDVLSVIGFKYTKEEKMKAPPAAYIVSDYEAPKIKTLDIRPKQRASAVEGPTIDPSRRAKPEESEPCK
ncbi:hypothetical protein PAXRUDRAFT_743132 [Paxillus rubicundulus Ve08.2h10]|uniref:Uncharacterized protein n=1 Tax=Paxillus rubicundulus Ve08.2h10 TaxID=930991 RepID=A0A0D0DCC3_9AGAM|nr:hypothetical protein PAXRUDRAFT_743132 [Paxillus rubicundulus Ve08.2h10]